MNRFTLAVLCLTVLAVSSSKTFSEQEVVDELTKSWKKYFTDDLTLSILDDKMGEAERLSEEDDRAQFTLDLEAFFDILIPDNELHFMNTYDSFKTTIIKKLKEASRFQ